ncbi:acyl-homoserine-lactone synthase [Entomohabitans teleogrylli]|uniref:acyl-homoserine-lactone synthase n=1 Tax=Entomohabitans teleogrylli TaxID=1384589 RepID=UPI00073D1CC9|nr:acyl-homoserine-lactone synthase [Entomohabitans teleogrylli]
MDTPIEFFTTTYLDLPDEMAEDLYRLRNQTFNTRLEWQVESQSGMEFDRFDSENATYLLGVCQGRLLCGVRFIDMKHENMIDEIFIKYFHNLTYPVQGKIFEATRLFIDKDRRNDACLQGQPITKMLFISMINFCLKEDSPGMYAVISKGMAQIFKRAGWNIQILNQGVSEKQEKIYFVFMPASETCITEILNKK